MPGLPGKTGEEMGWSRGRGVCTPIPGALASPFRARRWSQTEKGSLVRPRVHPAGCATIFSGRINITFLWLASGGLFEGTIHLGPNCLVFI